MLKQTTLVDTHTHSRYSGHGTGVLAEYIDAAARQGLWLIAQTEHMTFPFDLDPAGHIGMTYEQVPAYLAEIAAARLEHPELEIICGIEVDWLDGAEDFIRTQLQGPAGRTNAAPLNPAAPTTAAPLNPASAAPVAASPYELVLGSVHVLTDDPDAANGYWALDYDAEIAGWYERGADYVWREYLRLWLDAVESGFFDIMAHPDLPKKLGFYPSYSLQPMYQTMADAVAAAGLMIELNTSGYFMPAAEFYPGPELLAAFHRAGVPCTIGSDAHDPANVARALDQGRRALQEAGYRYLTVPRRDGDRCQIALAD